MKPPYIKITAKCEKHGTFQVERKPNNRRDTGSGRQNTGLYDAVKCLKCPWWATIIKQEIVTASDCIEQPISETLPDLFGGNA